MRINDCNTITTTCSTVRLNKVDVLHIRLTELHAAHQNLPFPPTGAVAAATSMGERCAINGTAVTAVLIDQ